MFLACALVAGNFLVGTTAANAGEICTEASMVVDLIAGGGNATSGTVVGKVYAIYKDDVLTVTYDVDYDVDQPGWAITETHLAVEACEADIPQTKKGNPVPGRFEYTDTMVDPVLTWTYVIENPPFPAYIAAHGVVAHADITEGTGTSSGGTIAGTANIGGEADVQETLRFKGVTTTTPYPVIPPPSLITSYFYADLFNSDDLDGDGNAGDLDDVYDSWCIEPHVSTWGLPAWSGVWHVSVEAMDSEEALAGIDGIIAGNYDLVNWLINQAQGWVGQSAAEKLGDATLFGTITASDIQLAIWELFYGEGSTYINHSAMASIGPETNVVGAGDVGGGVIMPPDPNVLTWNRGRVDAIKLTCAAQGEGWEPGAGDLMGAVLRTFGYYMSDGVTIYSLHAQTTIIGVPVPSTPTPPTITLTGGDETAWGAGCPFSEDGSASWAMYFILDCDPTNEDDCGTCMVGGAGLPTDTDTESAKETDDSTDCSNPGNKGGKSSKSNAGGKGKKK
ncbi:MAG: hypothetical protein JXB13_14405 [Phycisphaerae bacterium]|nr:hypothetical protein [Phycisphaerae bacterium]